MINNFTSVITWFKDISSSLLAWFFDTSNVNKVLLFVVPLFVIGAIFVLFDFIIPMFFDLPQWKLNRSLAVMSPKNTYGLVINKHLIPRSPYSLRRMFMSRFSGGSIKAYNSKTLKAWSSKDIKPFLTKDIKPFLTKDIKGFKTNDLRSFKTNDLRSFKTSDIRLFKTFDIRSLKSGDLKVFKTMDIKSFGSAEFRSFTPDKIGDFNIRPISTIKLGGLNPAEIRPFKVSDIRSLKPNDLRGMYINSRAIGSHLVDSRSLHGLEARRNFISGVNNLRVASPSYRINTNHELTKLGRAAVANARRTMQGGHDLAVDEETGEASAPSEL